MRQRVRPREHFRRGNALSYGSHPDCRAEDVIYCDKEHPCRAYHTPNHPTESVTVRCNGTDDEANWDMAVDIAIKHKTRVEIGPYRVLAQYAASASHGRPSNWCLEAAVTCLSDQACRHPAFSR
jgi:hypothetical protein